MRIVIALMGTLVLVFCVGGCKKQAPTEEELRAQIGEKQAEINQQISESGPRVRPVIVMPQQPQEQPSSEQPAGSTQPPTSSNSGSGVDLSSQTSQGQSSPSPQSPPASATSESSDVIQLDPKTNEYGIATPGDPEGRLTPLNRDKDH